MDVIPDSHFRLEGKAADLVKKEHEQGGVRYRQAINAITEKLGFPILSLLAMDDIVTAFVPDATKAEVAKIKGLKLFRNEHGELSLRPFGTSKEAREWRELLNANKLLSLYTNEIQSELLEHVFGITDGNPWFLRAANGKNYMCSISTMVFNDVAFMGIPTQVEKPKLVDAVAVASWEVQKEKQDAQERQYRSRMAINTSPKDEREFRSMVRVAIEQVPLVGLNIPQLVRWRDHGEPDPHARSQFSVALADHIAKLASKSFLELQQLATQSEVELNKAIRSNIGI